MKRKQLGILTTLVHVKAGVIIVKGTLTQI